MKNHAIHRFIVRIDIAKTNAHAIFRYPEDSANPMTNVLSELETVVFRMRREIAEDIASGIVPASAATYSDLHDYVDANGYGGAFEDSAHAVEDVDFWNAAQDEVDEWLRGNPPFAVCIICGANRLDVEASMQQFCCPVSKSS